ncbi:MAG: response regulator [Gemmatimonadales bacterium]|nr:response regulator [Gemmatimonadales bacterium]NIN09829.1 response regulator [Gemmatimonadales bacterium]NIN48532.1 response regulator [Gemmatimonadales bacterium]NIP05996.1 response regulator [Gemmatimonadales bacterium]NIR01146.1 response regulator [Gemmatimonadales bacterium]
MSTHAPLVLVADDQSDVLESLRLLLKGENFSVETAASPAAVLRALEAKDFDAVLMDLNYTRDTTSGREGLDLLPRIRGMDETLPVVVMTAWGSIEGAVEAMRRGARDYIEKPWDNTRLLATLRTQIELGSALRTTRRLRDENRLLRGEGYPTFIAESAAMQPVLRLMERVGPSDANVLITGEHGTGKEVVAQWLHAASTRAGKPFVTVNVGGLAENVFESELFGHVKGAFTDAKTDRVGRFELADGGTLFLDEIANIPSTLQSKLLRVLQSGEFERVGSSRTRRAAVRLLSATNADLATEVAEARFREDLLFRLNTVEIHLPPLRERREDIPLLAAHFLQQHARRYGNAPRGIDSGAMEALLAHQWPGNIRELDHVVERAVLMAEGEHLGVGDLGLHQSTDGTPSFEDMTLDEAEHVLIQRALKRFNGNVTEAAKALGVSRSALYRRIQRHGL